MSTPLRYRVVATIQSGDNPPVEMNWFGGTHGGESLPDAMAALVQAAVMADQDVAGATTEQQKILGRTRLLDVRLIVIHP